MTTGSLDQREKGSTPVAFWLLGAALLLFVALCTGQRDSLWDTDSWEHHRAIVALVRDLWHPGNPVYAVDVPSIRYSPYSVVLALICRRTGADPYFVLGVAGVVNWALVLLAVWALLKSFGEQRIAAAALVVMISLYGKTPGYPNTFALADLPWHALNPSTFAFALVVFAGAILKWMTTTRETRSHEGDEVPRSKEEGPVKSARGMVSWAMGWCALFLLMTEAMLDHGMTGMFGFMLMLVIAATRARGVRVKAVAGVLVLGIVVAGACTRWPWYSFMEAIRSHRDVDYWFNEGIEKRMLLEWTAPAVLLCVLGFAYWKRELVRVMLIGGAVCWGVALVSFGLKSAALARFPLPGMMLLDLPIALYCFETGVFCARTWPGRLRALFGGVREESALRASTQGGADNHGLPPMATESRRFAAPTGITQTGAILQVMAAAMLLYCLVPQVLATPTEPQLGRVWVSTLLHKEDKQLHLKIHFDDLLKPSADGTWLGIGEDDVVFSDPWSSWPVPSSRGKVVSAQHLELFVDGQMERRRDAEQFFAKISDAERIALLEKYHAKWILWNPAGPEKFSPWVMGEVLEPTAIVRREAVRGMDGSVQEMVLMDAGKWEAAREALTRRQMGTSAFRQK